MCVVVCHVLMSVVFVVVDVRFCCCLRLLLLVVVVVVDVCRCC